MKVNKLQRLINLRYKLKGIDPDSIYSLRESFNLDAITGTPINSNKEKK